MASEVDAEVAASELSDERERNYGRNNSRCFFFLFESNPLEQKLDHDVLVSAIYNHGLSDETHFLLKRRSRKLCFFCFGQRAPGKSNGSYKFVNFGDWDPILLFKK